MTEPIITDLITGETTGPSLEGVVEPKQDRRHTSFSQLNVYQQCGTKYQLSYVDKVPREPQGSFLGGSAVHKTIERSEKEGLWVDPDNADGEHSMLAEIFHETFASKVTQAGGPDVVRWGGRKSRAFPNGEDFGWWISHGGAPAMLWRYGEVRRSWAEAGFAPVEGGVEMRVEVELPGVDRPLLSFIDVFLMHEMGEPLIVDWSTGMVGGKSPMQFATYAAIIKAAQGIDVQRGYAIYLRANEPEQRVQESEFKLLTPHMPRVYSELLRGVDAELFEPNPNSFCKSCSVRAYCWYFAATQGKEPER